jgi:hypothetical protein
MKKSFSLLITLFLLSIFAYLSISILETKSLRKTNLQNQYLYIQAVNHKEFLKEYIKSIDLNDIKHLSIENESFNIYSIIKQKEKNYEIDLFVKSKTFKISIHEKIIK